MQKQGMPQGPIVSMFTTLQEMKHHIRTIFGVSTITFDSAAQLYAVPVQQRNRPTTDEIIQGIRQGNGAGPQIWAVVSPPILEMLREAGCECYFKIAISGRNIFRGIRLCG